VEPQIKTVWIETAWCVGTTVPADAHEGSAVVERELKPV